MKENSDKGWAWVILVSTWFSCVNLACLAYNTGVLNVALLAYYERTVATTSIIGSVFLCAIFLIGGPIASFLINRFGCRVAHIIGGVLAFIGFTAGFFVKTLELLILTYGVFAGAGIGICYTNTNVILSFNFKKYLGLSIGLTTAGGGIGIFISGPFCQYLLDTYGLNGCYLILGGMALNEIVFGALMLPSYEEKRHRYGKLRLEEDMKTDFRQRCHTIFQFKILKNKPYVVALICNFLWTISYGILLFHLPNFAVVKGFSPEEGALLITALGIGSAISRLLTGLAVGPNGLDPYIMFFGFIGILGALTLTFPLYFTSQASHLAYSFLFGIYTGGLIAIKNPLVMHLVGVKYVSTAIGLFFFLEGIAFFGGPPVTGLIIDATGLYENMFFLSGAIFIAAFLLSLVSSLFTQAETCSEGDPEIIEFKYDHSTKEQQMKVESPDFKETSGDRKIFSTRL